MGSSGGETAQVRVMADVMQYDSENRAWVPCQGSGASNISLLQSLQNQTYRIIGQKAEDPNRISVNSSVIPSLIYNEATPRFHQWRAQGTVYGLNFATAEQASDFAREMKLALEYVKGEREWPQPVRAAPPQAPPPPAPTMSSAVPRPPAPPMMHRPAPPSGGPPRPPGPPPGPAGPPPPGPPPPSSSAAPPSSSGGGGGDGRSALMEAIRGGAALKKTQGPPVREGPGNILGSSSSSEEKKQRGAPPPSSSNRAGPGPMDFAAELQNRFNKKNTTQHVKPEPPQPQVHRIPPKIHNSNTSTTSNNSSSSNTAQQQPSNSEIQRIIQEELAKMKDQFLADFRQMLREELAHQ